MTPPRVRRWHATAAVFLFAAVVANPAVALGIPSPTVDTTAVPADGPPGPEQAMRQSSLCARPVVAAGPAVSEPAPALAMLNVEAAWRYSTGNGVTVAVIDTGVSPSPRLPVLPGGDYIAGGDGLADCDAHGTIVASLIAARPQGIPEPRPMPPTVPPTLSLAPVTAVPTAKDGVVGVAPHATLISIRQSSRAFVPVNPGTDSDTHRRAVAASTLARAIVHAANLGADVINVGLSQCFPAAEPPDHRALGAAVWYAATVKDAVIVAAAGNDGEDGCVQNPTSTPPGRDGQSRQPVKTVSSPSWFADHVLSVGAVNLAGTPLDKSLAGPWIGVAAPGVSIIGLSPDGGAPVNAYPPPRPGEDAVPLWGTSFAAAYVSGVAALVRAESPKLTAPQVIHRIRQTAHNPAPGVDNRVGYGVVDPVAALTFDVADGDRVAAPPQTTVLAPPAAAPPPDRRAQRAALVFAGAVGAGLLLACLGARIRRLR